MSGTTTHFKHSKFSINRLILVLVGLTFSLTLSNPAFAQPLAEFNATFKIHALGMTLGESKHVLSCDQGDCTLTVSSKPKGLARFLLNEQSQETIQIKQSNDQFDWLSYTKKYGKDLSDKDQFKIESFFVDPKNSNKIINPNRQKSWPVKPEIYDSISLAYAVQFNVLNEKPLNQFFLQESNRQQPLVLKSAFTQEPLKLDGGKMFSDAQRFDFETQKAKVKIWLIPRYDYFPARVEVYNIIKEQTLTLVLQEPPKIQ